MEVLFPFAEYWWFYAGFLMLVLAMLAVDLGVFHRDAHVVTFRESLTWSAIWVSIALAFNYAFYLYAASKFGGAEGQRLGLEFFTGYIVEKSLAVDNIFVFVLVFAYFGIPPQYQHRVLFYGIVGALVFRAIFIALGSVLMQYAAIVTIFGLFLLLTGVKMLFAPDQKVDPDRNPVIRLFKRVMPVTQAFHGQKFLVQIDGRWHATPLMLALLRLTADRVALPDDLQSPLRAPITPEELVYHQACFARVPQPQ